MLSTKTKENQTGRLIVVGIGVTPGGVGTMSPIGEDPHGRVNFPVSSKLPIKYEVPHKQGPVNSAIYLIFCFK